MGVDELDSELVGLLLCSYKGDLHGCYGIVARLRRGGVSMAIVVSGLGRVSSHCLEILGAGAEGEGYDEALELAAGMMGMPFVCRAARAWADADAHVRLGVDAQVETRATMTQLALRRAASASGRDTQAAGVAEVQMQAPPPVTKDGGTAVAGEPELGPATVAPAVTGAFEVGVAPESPRPGAGVDQRLARAWGRIVDGVQNRRKHMYAGICLGTKASGLAVSPQGEVIIYFESADITRRLGERTDEMAAVEEVISSELGKPTRVKVACDKEGSVQKVSLRPAQQRAAGRTRR